MIENTLSLYAVDVALLPASGLYGEIPPNVKAVADKCHIYLIGLVPIVSLLNSYEKNGFLCIDVTVGTQKYISGVKIPIPEGHSVVRNSNGVWLSDGDGKLYAHSVQELMRAVSHQISPLGFKVLYIGQAFGKDGSRAALDRLREHSTLQKIAVQGTAPRHRLELVLFGIDSGNRLITEFNPFAVNTEDATARKRIKDGLDKLFDTSEAERVALYEAALIRYFQPEFNIMFKDSFPSTNQKLLNDCYQKDIKSLVAEIHFDDFPYQFFSEAISMNWGHTAHFDLHDEESRKSFFSPFR